MKKEFDLTIPFHSSCGAISFRKVRITAPDNVSEKDIEKELEQEQTSISFCEMVERAAKLEMSDNQSQVENEEFEALLQRVCNKNGWVGKEVHDLPFFYEL